MANLFYGNTYGWRLLVVFKQSPNFASVDDAMSFIVILHSTCTGPFSGGIAVICVLFMDFGPRKNTHQLCCVHMVLRCRINLNRCVGL